MNAEIAGRIGTDKKPRQRLTLAQRVAKLEKSAERHRKLASDFDRRAVELRNEQREKAKAMLAEAEGPKDVPVAMREI